MKTALFPVLLLLSATALRGADRTPFDLTTLLGETYHNCRILKVTPAALTVAYDSGVSKVPFELLGDAWRELYHYDPDKARDFAEREEAKRQQAEAKRRELMRAAEKYKNEQMSELLKAERQREDLEAKLAKEQAEEATKSAPPKPATPALAPYPGDGAVPNNPPISQIFTPGQSGPPADGSGYPPAYNMGGSPFTHVPGYVYPPSVFVPPGPRLPFRGAATGPGHRPGGVRGRAPLR